MSACESQTNVVYKVNNRTGRLVDVTSGRTTRGWRQSLGHSAGESVHVEVCACTMGSGCVGICACI